MGGIGAWLVALAPALARRVLAALGFGLVSYVGLEAAIGALLSAAKVSLGAAGAAGQIIALAGFGQACSIIAGAIVTRIAFFQLKRLVPH